MSNIHALVIDDDPNSLTVMETMLASVGIRGIMLQDPMQLEAALQQSGSLDLVFLDLEMPDIDGYQVFRFLKGQLGDRVPIIACTVHNSELFTAHELGFHSFITKPLSLEEFPKQVKRILNGERVWDKS